MASPQLDNGYTPIANEIVEALMRINLSGYESRVLWFIFRKTYGFKKKTDWIALSQFSKAIGLDRRLIHRAIKKLSSKKMIVIQKDDGVRVRYGFQKDYTKWKLSSKKMTVIQRDDELSSKEMTRVSSKEIPTKETITKETIQKKRTILSGKSQNHIPYQEIIDYLNQKTERSYKPTTPKTRTLIQVLWKQGFQLQDFQKVIDNKVKDWITHPKYSKYLRPETLFGNKFEGYLNEQRHAMTGVVSEKTMRTIENLKELELD